MIVIHFLYSGWGGGEIAKRIIEKEKYELITKKKKKKKKKKNPKKQLDKKDKKYQTLLQVHCQCL